MNDQDLRCKAKQVHRHEAFGEGYAVVVRSLNLEGMRTPVAGASCEINDFTSGVQRLIADAFASESEAPMRISIMRPGLGRLSASRR